MHSLDHRITIAGIIALVGTALVMTHSIGGNGVHNAKFGMANPSISQPMPVAAMTRTVAVARDVGAETVFAGSEPDPEAFDQAGLDRWWATYQKAHPAR